MNIRDLDEYDGLTAEMVRAYLEKTGWTRATLDDIDPSRWTKGEHTIWLPLESEDLAVTIQGLSRVECRTPQAILRDINPRMIPFPSAAARRAHAGLWFGKSGPMKRREDTALRIHCGIGRFSFGSPCRGLDFPTIFWQWDTGGGERFAADDDDEFNDHGEFVKAWSFWPCDAAGNKVTWPKVNK